MNKFLEHPFHRTSVAKFIYSGVFMRGLAFLLNFIFADYYDYNHRVVYFLIMILDFFIGYAISRFYVFNETFNKSHTDAMKQFLIAGISFRVADWLFYVILVEKLELYILLAQAASMITIMVTKYFVHKKIFN